MRDIHRAGPCSRRRALRNHDSSRFTSHCTNGSSDRPGCHGPSVHHRQLRHCFPTASASPATPLDAELSDGLRPLRACTTAL